MDLNTTTQIAQQWSLDYTELESTIIAEMVIQQ